MDVIRAFLAGGELSEAALRTDGAQLFSCGRLIAEKREGKLHVMENAEGPLDRSTGRCSWTSCHGASSEPKSCGCC